MAHIDDPEVKAEGIALFQAMTDNPEERDRAISRVFDRMMDTDPESVMNAFAAIRLFAELLLTEYEVSDETRTVMLDALADIEARMRH